VAAFGALPPPKQQAQQQQEQQQEKDSGVAGDPWQQTHPHKSAGELNLVRTFSV
jgi:hypothetical protein